MVGFVEEILYGTVFKRRSGDFFVVWKIIVIRAVYVYVVAGYDVGVSV